MYYTKKQQWMIFGIVNGLFLFTILFFPFYNQHLAATPLTSCKFLAVTHLYCPGCGGTRAFAALTKFRLLDSLRYNPIVPFGALTFVIYEIIMIIYLIKGTKRPRLLKPWMVWTFLAVWMTYTIIRDILLLCGIDILLGKMA